jgi:glutamate-1-semialdehyde 2,1-aminomutase
MPSATERLMSQVEAEYRARTPKSAAMAERAQEAMPGGDTRHSVFFRPYPLFVERGEGAYITDVDGNRYLDCLNNYTSLILGHAHPAVVEALSRQLAKGTAYAAVSPLAVELAETIASRVESIERVRFTNSGSEATMLAVRAARAFTGRPKIVKMIGGYHGSHDDFEFSSLRPSRGIMPTAADHVIEVEFNNKDEVSRVLAEHGDEIAAVIVEGVLGSGGMLPPLDGYLTHLRAETERKGVLLILDEVISLRLATGGAQQMFEVRPDLTAMGKIVGGGLPVGALGGRADLMEQYSPLNPNLLQHGGTFNGNPMTMAAGLATLAEMDADSTGYINRLGERFAAGVSRVASRRGVPVQVTGAGSLRSVHFASAPPRHAVDAMTADKELLRLLHLKLLNDGVFIAPRGLCAFSTVTTEREIDGIIEAIDAALEWMQPTIEERAGVAAS